MQKLRWSFTVSLLLAGHAWSAELDVTTTGAVADGKTDCTAAFQKALDAAAAKGGGIVSVPTGHFRIDGILKIPGGVTLQGVFRTPPADQREGRAKLDGSVLLAYAGRGKPEGEPFIRLVGSMATVAGLMVTYPEWKQSDVPPVAYPPTVSAGAVANVAILDCCFLNSYEAIHFQDAARFLVRNVHGYPSFRGLYVDACYDIGRVENCHFWPFAVAYDPSNAFCKWVNANGVAFEFARTDWQYVTNTFCFGYGVGYKFSKTKNGTCNGNFVGIGADSCLRPVLVEDSQFPGLLITNGEFVGRWANADAVGIEIAEGAGDGKVSLSNCSFWGPLDRCVWLRSARTQFTAIGTHFLQWDTAGRGSPAVQVDAGKAIIQGNTFGEGELHVEVGPRARSVIVMGNQAGGGLRVSNHAGPRTQLVANETSPIEWSDAARLHYRVDIGVPGDQAYVHRTFGAEPWNAATDKTMRWSTGATEFSLPVARGKPYTLTLNLNVPPAAVAKTSGLYLGEKRIAELPDKSGETTVTAQLPPASAGSTVVTLRVKTWVPKDVTAGSQDARQLGVTLLSLTMKADGAPATIFDANTGDPLPPAAK